MPDDAVVFVEIPSGSRNKYEWDAELVGIVLDRLLFTAMTYPADYGYVEGTLAESLGAVESLIEHPGVMTHASAAGSPLEVPDNLVRLSVGIESSADLVADLEQALDSLGG